MNNEQIKSQFVANMSHELRTPLNSLLILSQILAENEDGNLTSKQIDFAKSINACGSELLALINDMLDLAKLESGKMVVHRHQVTLTEIKSSLERTFGEIAKRKKLDFRVDIDQRVVRSMFTDGKRLHQVLNNLLSNALKFTSKGSVILHIDQASAGSDPKNALRSTKDVISFMVSDTGIGIAQDKQKKIFDPFEQAEATTDHKYGGTGLGLAISREIATMLGGQLIVASELGKGSTFTLQLPHRRSNPMASAPL
jgi:signal transduction histidine kinase